MIPSLRQDSKRSPRFFLRLFYLMLIFAIAIITRLWMISWQQVILFLIGLLFGVTLYHASFGFSSAYRQLFVRQEVRGVLAQILMLGIATLLFAPILLSNLGRGSVAPVSVQGAIGAFIFGIGMQLGGGCACGTLYTIGSGSIAMILTLITFGIGLFLGTLTHGTWSQLPQTEPISLIMLWGWRGVGLQLFVLAGLGFFIWRTQPRSLMNDRRFWHWPTKRSLLFGPWSLMFGAIALAGLNALTLLIAKRPWGVTWGFTLWTAKLATWLGWQPESSDFWQQAHIASLLQDSLLTDVVVVTNIGIILGAAFAAILAHQWSPKPPLSGRVILASLLGGLMMGYGAWFAFGCNVGAYFSGIASTSLHGWLWIIFALMGTGIGVRLRPFFDLSN